MREKIANLKAHPRVLDIFATKSSCKNMNVAATYEQIRALVTKPTTDAVVTGVEGLSKAHLVWQIAQTKSVIWPFLIVRLQKKCSWTCIISPKKTVAAKFSTSLLKNAPHITLRHQTLLWSWNEAPHF